MHCVFTAFTFVKKDRVELTQLVYAQGQSRKTFACIQSEFTDVGASSHTFKFHGRGLLFDDDRLPGRFAV